MEDRGWLTEEEYKYFETNCGKVPLCEEAGVVIKNGQMMISCPAMDQPMLLIFFLTACAKCQTDAWKKMEAEKRLYNRVRYGTVE
jgi:hypothetical protein